MKNTTATFFFRTAFFALLVFLHLPFSLWSQTRYRASSGAITVAGTSTLHDWKETSSKGSVNAVFTMSGNKISDLALLVFTVPVTSLKSEHKTMDNNTYKALKANKHPEIAYTLSSATVTPVNATTFTIKTKGKLTIAGTTRETDVDATAKVNADNSITVTGSKKLKMTDYGVTPPKVMMIKTGNDLTISYNLRLMK
ncbi:MAG TPA: YceI family protein [Chitinophagaceae bacterium]